VTFLTWSAQADGAARSAATARPTAKLRLVPNRFKERDSR